MRKLLICIFLLTMSIPAVSYVEDWQCKFQKKIIGIDLSNQFCEEPRDQDTMGWCYANTTADHIGAYRFRTQGIDPCTESTKISASAIANQYNRLNEEKKKKRAKAFDEYRAGKKAKFMEPSSGRDYIAAGYAFQNGFCLERDVPSEDFNTSKNGKCKTCNIRKIFDQFYSTSKDLLNSDDQCYERTIAPISALFPKLSIEHILDITKNVDIRDQLDAFVDLSCKKQMVKPENRPTIIKNFTIKKGFYKNIVKAPYTKKEFEQVKLGHLNYRMYIDKNLKKGKVITVSYRSDFLKGKTGTESHASIVIGQNYNCKTGKEEYILRNTWGATCAPMLKERTKADYKKIKECKNGISSLKEFTKVKKRLEAVKIRANNKFNKTQAHIMEMLRGHIKKYEQKLKKMKNIVSSPAEAILEKAKCQSKTPRVSHNPKVRCEAGKLYIEKSEFSENAIGTTVYE